jgi:hypothetical protein
MSHIEMLRQQITKRFNPVGNLMETILQFDLNRS